MSHSALFVGGFANILTYGFSKMDGLAGLAGWQWIFVCFLDASSGLYRVY